MKSFKKLLLLTAVGLSSCSPKIHEQAQAVRRINSKTLGVNYQEALVRTLEKENIKEDTLQFNFTYWGSWKDSRFYSATDTIVITNDGVEQEFIHWISGNDSTVLDIYKQFNPGTYDENYKAQNRGHVNVAVPQVYELTNILVALTGNAKSNWVEKDTEYYRRVQEYFKPYKNHPVIAKLESELEKGQYLNIRENSAAYVFDGQRIVPSGIYAGFRARDRFKKLLPLIQDFAAKSSFLTFYKSEQAFYTQLESLEQEKAQVKEAWDWLQQQFPDKVDSYRIIMSPVAGSSHSIRLFENNGFKENIIFMSAPSTASGVPVALNEVDVQTMRRAFTEIDHNYVNPVSDTYLQEINEAMSRPGNWNTSGRYSSSYETFNEYMTWAVFGLYVYDRFGEAAYREMMAQPIDFMEKSRGFVKFGAFNRQLLNLFQKHRGEQKVPDLYPEMLEWVKAENYSS